MFIEIRKIVMDKKTGLQGKSSVDLKSEGTHHCTMLLLLASKYKQFIKN